MHGAQCRVTGGRTQLPIRKGVVKVQSLSGANKERMRCAQEGAAAGRGVFDADGQAGRPEGALSARGWRTLAIVEVAPKQVQAGGWNLQPTNSMRCSGGCRV